MTHSTTTKTCYCRQLKKTATLTITCKIEKVKGENIEIFEKLECNLRPYSDKGLSCNCELERLLEMAK